MLKIILGDNQAIFRAGAAKVLAVEDDMRIVAQADSLQKLHMALTSFTRNYSDRCNDTGYQFEFYCDKCGNGHLSRFQASQLGILVKLVRAASWLVSGEGRSGGHSVSVPRQIRYTAYADTITVTSPASRASGL